MKGEYVYDKDKVGFRKEKFSVWRILRNVLIFLVTTISMAILYYVIFALFFSTDQERRLRQENRMYEKEYPALEEKEKLLDVISTNTSMYDDINVYIGKEDDPSAMRDTTMIFKNVNVGGKRVSIGVIGPKRMDYSRVIGMITQLANAIDSTFSGRGLLGEGDGKE